MNNQITLKYEWTNWVDAVDLANSILWFAKVFSKISKDKYWEDSWLKIDVNWFEKWSLDAILNIDFDWDRIGEWLWVIATIITIIEWVVHLRKFLKWNKPKKIKPDTKEINNYIIENAEGKEISIWKTVYTYYVDNSITYNLYKYVEPSEKDERISSQSIIDWDSNEVCKIEKWEVEFFKEEDDIINQEVSVIWKIYDMNTDTFNWKVDLWWNKVSISFKKIYETEHFNNLITSLKYKALISIKWIAEYDRWNNNYKNIDITEVEILQDTLFEEGAS